MKKEFKRKLNRRESWIAVMLLSLFCALIFGIWMSSGAWFGDRDRADLSVTLATIEVDGNTNESLRKTVYVALRNQQILSEDITFCITPRSSEFYARIGVFVTTDYPTSAVAKDVIKFQNFVPTENEGYTWVRDGEWYYFCDQNGKPVPLSHKDSGKAFGFMGKESFVMPNVLRPQHYASDDTVELEIRIESVQARNVEDESVTKLAPFFTTQYPKDDFVVTFKDQNENTLKTVTTKYAGDVTPPTAANVAGKIFESWNTLKDGTGADISGEEFNNISQNLTLYPRYKSNEVTVTVVQTANGEITPGTTTTIYGDTLNFDVKANGGYKISSILLGGQSVEIKDENEQTVVVQNIIGDTTLTATYALKDYLISVMSTGDGVTTPNTNQSVRFGDDISFTFAANEGKYISSLKIDGVEKISGVSTKNYEHTFNSVSADHSVDVVYETSIYSITTNVVAHSDGYNYGEITPTENTCAHGKSVNFTVSAFSGAKISSIKVNGVEKLVGGNDQTKTNINVAPTSDTLVEATFEPLWKMTKIDSKFYITEYLGNNENLVVPARIYDAASGADVNVYGVRSLNYMPISLTLSSGIEYVGGNGSNNIFSTTEAGVTSITLPNSITTIDSRAFLGCSEIVNFGVPSKLQKIGDYAFANCSSITSYDLPKTLLQIGVGAFDGNVNMSQLTFNSVAAPTIADGSIFAGTTSNLKVRVPVGGKASYVSNLSNRSFAENTYMYGLTGTTPIAIYKDNIFRYIYYIDILNSSGGSSNPPTGRVQVYQTQNFSVTFTPSAGNRIEAIYVDSSDENLMSVAEGDSQTYVFENIQNSHLIEAVYSKMYVRLDINGGTGKQPLVVYNDDKSQFKINDNIEPTKSGKEFYYYSTNKDDNEQGQNGTRYDLGLWYDLPSTTASTTLYAIYLTPTSYTTTSQYVVVPKTVNAIAGSSSKNMFGSSSDSTLKYITLHRNTTTIGSYALYGCKTLTGISHSDGVVALGSYAMAGCVELVKYRFSPLTQSVGTFAFASDTKLESVTNLENTQVSQISEAMFCECSSLYEILLPNTITSIGNEAFAACEKLTSVDLSKTKTATIGVKGFAYCGNLSKIQFPTTLTLIDDGAFTEDKNLRSVQNLEKTIVSKIGYGVFEGCSNLSSVKLPQTLSTLGESAFEGCSNLTAVSGFENTAVKILEARTFANCSSLSTLSLARGLTEIGTEALIGCSILRNLDTLSTTKVTTIGKSALKDTAGLTSISLPTSTFVSFAQSAFENSGVQKISNLKNCSKFKSFGASSFMNSGLKEIEFPNCTFSIEASAFKNCTALTKATFNSKTAPTAQETSFEGTTSALQVYIPNGSIDAYAPLSLGGLHHKGFSSGFDTTLSDYNVVEYIESTGTQYIDTGLIMEKSTTMRMEISAQLTSNGNWAGVNGYMQHQASLGGGSKGLFVVDYNGNTHIENVYFNNTLKYTQDWTSAYSGAKNKVAVIGMGNAENTWWTNISSNRYAQVGKWYYIKVYRSGTLVRDYVPCVRNSDGVAGLYDKVENKFYTNSGTGSFGSGAATGVLVEEYQRVEYIENSGTQYINTGYYWTSDNVRAVLSANVTTHNQGESLFGNEEYIGRDRYFALIPHNSGGTMKIFSLDRNLIEFTYPLSTDMILDVSASTKGSDKYVNLAITSNGSTKNYGGKATTGGSVITNPNNLKTGVGEIYLFANHNSGAGAVTGGTPNRVGNQIVGKMKVYSFKMYDNNILVRDFVPVVRSRDGVAGMYDMVGHKFYTNAGSGSFEAGGVIPADKGMSNGATMHFIGKSQVVATCIEDIFKRHFDITMSDATYYFDANKTRTIEINEELPAGVVVKYTWKKSSGETGSGNSFKDVGTYHVTATIAGSYYATTTATATLTIVQPSLSGITFTDKTFVYDGTQKKIEITGTLIEGASVSYSIKGVNGESVDAGATNGTTQVGVYEVKATFGGNLAGNTLVAYLTILKATHRVTLSNKTVTYNGNAHTLALPTLPSGMSVASSSVSGKEYDDNHNPTKPVSATQNGGMVTRTNAGNYTITVNFNGGRNYNDTSSSATLIIQAANLTISFAKTNAYNGKGWEYDGTTHEVKATVSNGANVPISYSYTGTLSGSDNNFRDAGTYNLTATLNAGPNYFAASASVTFTITKANLSTTLNNETFVYTGSPHTYTLTNGIVGKGNDGTFAVSRCSIVYSYTGREFTPSDTEKPTGSEVSVNGNTATNAGWYSTKLVITAPLSSNNIQNYNTLTITGTNNFKITKAPSSFNVGEVWVLSGTTFKNPVKSDNVILQSGKFISSDSQKVEVRTSDGETSFYVTTKVVDRTSSTAASKVTITAQFNNYVSSSFVINLVPFSYSESSKTISSYTSSYGNIDGGVLFPHSVSASKMVDSVIQPKESGLNTFTVDSVGGYSVLSTEYEYNRVEFSEGIVSVSGYWSFENAKINEIITPSTLTSFGNCAFKGSTAKTLTLKSSSITFNNNALSNMNSLKVIHNEKDLSNGYSLLNINSKVWRLSSNVLDENNINFSSTSAVSELKAKGHYYPVAENSVSVDSNSTITWYSTLNAACNYAKGKTATVTVWRNINISSSIVLDTASTNIKLTAQYECIVTRAAANFDFFHVGSGSKLNLLSGIILDGAKDTYTTNTTTVVYAGLGQFVMSGGTIRNNRSQNGGAIYIKENRSFTMEGGTIQNCVGTDGAGAIHMESGSTFTMTNGTIKNCEAEKLDGGAIYVSATAKVYLNGGTIESCTANNSGGALFITPTAQAFLSGGKINSCTASTLYGGAIYNNGTFTMNNSYSSIGGTVDNLLWASAAKKGGAIYNDGSGVLKLSAGKIMGKTLILEEYQGNSTGEGGAIYNVGSATISGGVKIDGIINKGNGGGIFVAGGTVRINSATITGKVSSSGSGGGIYASGGTVTLNNGGKIDSCSATNGGGVYVAGGTFKLNSGTIDGCSATYGGGVATSGSGKFDMTNGTISNNTASENGGGIWCDTAGWTGSAADTKISGGSISYNSAVDGGGIYLNNPNDGYSSIRTLSIWGGTISGNEASNNGGGIYVDILTEIYFSHESQTPSSPVITSNVASNDGGGIYMNTPNKFYFWKGTTITSNTALNGAGVFITTIELNTRFKDFNGTFYFNDVKIYNNKNDSGQAVQLTLSDYYNYTTYVLTGRTKIEGRVQMANKNGFSLGDAGWSNTTVIEIEPLGNLASEYGYDIKHRLLRNLNKSISTDAPKNKKQYFTTTKGKIIDSTYRFDNYNSCSSLLIVK